MPGQTHRGNPRYGLQGFLMELTPGFIPCCIGRILEEYLHLYTKAFGTVFFPLCTLIILPPSLCNLPNLSLLELDIQVEYQTKVGIPSSIWIQIGIPSQIVNPLGECGIGVGA